MYRRVVVRFLKSTVPRDHTFAFSRCQKGRDLLNEDVNDSPSLQEALQLARIYVTKDKEAILLSRPSPYLTEWFDVATCLWRPVSEWGSSSASAARSRAEVPPAALSQAGEPAADSIAGSKPKGISRSTPPRPKHAFSSRPPRPTRDYIPSEQAPVPAKAMPIQALQSGLVPVPAKAPGPAKATPLPAPQSGQAPAPAKAAPIQAPQPGPAPGLIKAEPIQASQPAPPPGLFKDEPASPSGPVPHTPTSPDYGREMSPASPNPWRPAPPSPAAGASSSAHSQAGHQDWAPPVLPVDVQEWLSRNRFRDVFERVDGRTILHLTAWQADKSPAAAAMIPKLLTAARSQNSELFPEWLNLRVSGAPEGRQETRATTQQVSKPV